MVLSGSPWTVETGLSWAGFATITGWWRNGGMVPGQWQTFVRKNGDCYTDMKTGWQLRHVRGNV